MGHLINPIGFRLIFFNNWKDTWVNTNNFLYSQLLHNIIDVKKLLVFFFDNFTIEKYGILYSHFLIEQNFFGYIIKIYFYDSIVEKKILRLEDTIRFFNRRNTKIFETTVRLFNKKKFFRKINFINYFLTKRIIFFFIYLISTHYKINYRIKMFFFKFYIKNFNKIWLTLIKIFNIEIKKKKIVVEISLFFFVKVFFFLLKKKICHYKNKIYRIKKKITFKFLFKMIYILYDLWTVNCVLLKKLLMFKEIKIFRINQKLSINQIQFLQEFTLTLYSSLYRLFFIWFRQVGFFKTLKKIIFSYLKKASLLKTNFRFFGIENNNVSSEFLARFFIKKIEANFNINKIFNYVGDDLDFIMRKKNFVKGYKFQFIGRVTRRDRVKTIWLKNGLIPLGIITAKIDYSLNLGILRNGICCVRVWIYTYNSVSSIKDSYKYEVKII